MSQAETGDLLFLDQICNDLCIAIREVTREQYKGEGFDANHMGILSVENEKIFLYEAVPDLGVVISPIEQVLARSLNNGQTTLGKIQPQYRDLAYRSVERAKLLLNMPYDPSFIYSHRTTSCANLMHRIFSSDYVFPHFLPLSPMYFGKVGSPARKVFEDYYDKLKIPIPDGQLGSNPRGHYISAMKSGLIY